VAAHRPSGTLVEPHGRGVGSTPRTGKGPTPSVGHDATGAAASPPRSFRAPRRQPTAVGDGHERAQEVDRGFCSWARRDSNPRLLPCKNPATPPPGHMRRTPANRHSARRHEPLVRGQRVGKPPQPVTWPAANPALTVVMNPVRSLTLRHRPCRNRASRHQTAITPTASRREPNRAGRQQHPGRGGRAAARRPRGGSPASSASPRPIPRSAGSWLG
jgi:hypothetical protein